MLYDMMMAADADGVGRAPLARVFQGRAERRCKEGWAKKRRTRWSLADGTVVTFGPRAAGNNWNRARLRWSMKTVLWNVRLR